MRPPRRRREWQKALHADLHGELGGTAHNEESFTLFSREFFGIHVPPFIKKEEALHPPRRVTWPLGPRRCDGTNDNT